MTCSTSNKYQLQCNWTAPYTYDGVGITEYVVIVTQCSLQVYTVSLQVDTLITYTVTNGYGIYTVCVVAMIGDIAGEASMVEVTITQGIDIMYLKHTLKLFTVHSQFNNHIHTSHQYPVTV